MFDSDFKGKLCHIWNKLAERAYNLGMTYTVLFGDDIIIRTVNWFDVVKAKYSDIAADIVARQPNLNTASVHGFGCVCLGDEACPNFPSFPVVHHLHFDAMGGKMFPLDFINQDADPFLFALYSRFDASRFCSAKVHNLIGGHGPARYSKVHIDWKNDLLTKAVSQVSDFMHMNSVPLTKGNPSLDVVIPTYRCNLDILRGICTLNAPNRSTFFLVCVDKPEMADVVKKNLEKLPFVRVRSNKVSRFELLVSTE